MVGTPGGVLDVEEAWELLQAGRTGGEADRRRDHGHARRARSRAGQIDEFYRALEELHIEVVAEPRRARGGTRSTEAPEVSTDSLQLFLKDIGKVDLLTAAQEVELAKRIERGDHCAKQAMVEANLRLVVSIAKSTATRACPSSI